ncbi:MAG: EAL domain-containing protein, partial [Betaproteobacteria bacterium]
IQAILDSDLQSWNDEYRFIRADGSDSYVLDRGYVIRDASGKAIRMIGAMMDITGRKLAEEALRLTERAIEASVNPIIITTDPLAGACIVYVNPAFERVTGYTRDEVTGRNCNFLQRDDRNQADLEKLREALHEGRDCHAVLRNYRKDGSLFWNDLYVTPVRDAQQKITHFVGVQYDITDTRRYREELEHQANHDALTGLANRNLLADRLKQALVYAQRHARLVIVAFVDLDHFKFINDSLGHSTGDRLLIVIAERLLACVRKGDTVARPGGDEFVLILSDQTLDEDHHRTMDRIMAAVSDPCTIDGQELRVTCSIGLSVYPDDATDGETLLRMADAAMYRAKDTGRNSFQFHTKELTARIGDRLTLEAGLRRALDRDELFLNYQPQYDLVTGEANGMEALVRWAHPERGLIPPGAFIPLAEENGLIVQIGEWVARTACAHNKALQDAGLAPIKVAINLSARQFRHKGLVKSIDRIITESGLEVRYVELELTESMVMLSPDDAARTLAEFKEMGVQLSLDDFGTGYSSLSYLKKFPVHRLKVDQSFVRDMGADLDDTAIVQSIIALGHALNLKVCAEGVETAAQLEFLKTCRCDEAQGYLFSRPVMGDAIRELLMQSRISTKIMLV